MPRARLLAVALCCASSPALARISTLDLTCAQARGLLMREGAAVLGTGGQTYDRFVRDASFCQPTEVGRRAFVPARDTRACFIGYTCYEPSANDRFGDY
ncbi:hypothetical protein [Methylobacterium organophilum]|uniref:Uncharacterized protein n=1 Tax=Methylobacterium organophilum TaxID=410 RepID=A0ABQ4TBL4_METOR|nr:hypothetical protein [Methylobacterium organophilum]GJE28409.1 hypothetical protein LKMONMHP_3280 [Methylobacterium organophilum]